MKLFDAYGRLADTAALKGEQSAPTLAGVRNIYSNLYPTSGLTPEKLIGINRQADFGDPYMFLEMCEEIEEKDLHYLAVLSKRKMAVSKLEIIIQPASDSRFDIAAADFLTEALLDRTRFNLREHLYDISDALGKGFSAMEIIWNTAGRRVGQSNDGNWWIPVNLLSRDPRWFMFDWISGQQILVRTLRTDGQALLDAVPAKEQITGGAQHLAGDWSWNLEARKIGLQPLTAPLTPFKFITHFAKAKSGLPIRAGLTRCISWAYLFKNLAQKDWATFVEKYGQPMRLGKFPEGATEADKAVLMAAVANIGADMAGVIPNSMEISFEGLSTAAQQSDMFEKYMAYLENNQSKAVLGSTLGTELRGSTGSKAAAGTHREVERDIMEWDALRLEATLNRDLVKPAIDLNYGEPPTGRYPVLRIGVPDDQDVTVYVDALGKLADHGMKIGVKGVREKLKIQEPAPDEELLTPSQRITERTQDGVDTPTEEPLPPSDPGEEPFARRHVGARRRMRLHQQVTLDPGARRGSHGRSPRNLGSPGEVAEKFAEDLRRGHWQEVMDPMVGALLDEIKAAHSFADLKTRLQKVASRMDPGPMRDSVQRAIFNARMAGRMGAKLK